MKDVGVQSSMENAILDFIEFLKQKKKSSENTIVSYERDIRKLCRYLQETHGITQWKEVTPTHLTSYMLYMEKQNYASSSVSRSVASARTFFQYLRMQYSDTASIRQFRPCPQPGARDPCDTPFYGIG